jgi:predicted Zn-dependent protease
LKKRADKARASEAAQNPYGAFLAYLAIAEDFGGLRDVAEFENKAKQLRESKAVKEQARQERDEDARQVKYVNEFLALKSKLKEPDDRAITLSEIRASIAAFRKRSDAKDASSDRLVARRTLGTFFAESFETAQALLYSKNYAEAATQLELATFVRPENPGIFFSLGRAYALGGEKKKAITALQRSVEKGFANAAAFDDPAFSGLRDEAGFKKLVEDLKKKS